MIKNKIDTTIEESQIVNIDYYENLKNQLTCQICFGLLSSPVMCATCETPFCTNCINQWKSKKNTCPTRCSNIFLREVPRLFKKYVRRFEDKV